MSCQPTVQPGWLAVGIELEAKFCGDDYAPAKWRERFTDYLFVREGSVDLRGIEERHATLYRRADQSDSLLLVGRWAVAIGEAHAAEPEGGNFEVTVSELALVHHGFTITLSAFRSFIAR